MAVSGVNFDSFLKCHAKTAEKAEELIESCMVIGSSYTPVLPLFSAVKRHVVKHHFIKDEQLAGVLACYGKLVSPVKIIPMESKSPLLKHVIFFQSSVYEFTQ